MAVVDDIFTYIADAFTPFYDLKRFMFNQKAAEEKKVKEAAFVVNHTEKELAQELFRRRCQIRDKCLGHPKITEQLGGLVAKVIQRNAYSDEALLGEIIAMYVEFILSPAIHLFDLQIKKAIIKQHETKEHLSIIYREGKDSPTIYKLNEKGELDLTKPVENPDELLVWQNGYFPDPEMSDPRTFIRILSMCLADFTGKMLGARTVDELNRVRLGLQEPHASNNKAPAPPAATNPPVITPKAGH